ncbi:MAG: hypothetical protein ABI741_16620 [Ferruginibacter sp.]
MKKIFLLISLALTTISLNANYSVKGKIIFECKMKGTEGKIEVFGKGNDSRKVGEMNFSKDESNCTFHYTIQLEPGDYRWQFNDNKQNENSGEVSVKSGQIKNIDLLEKKKETE